MHLKIQMTSLEIIGDKIFFVILFGDLTLLVGQKTCSSSSGSFSLNRNIS